MPRARRSVDPNVEDAVDHHYGGQMHPRSPWGHRGGPGARVGYVGDFSVTGGAAAAGGGSSASAAPARPAQQRPRRVQAAPGDPLRVRAPDLSQEHRSLPLAEPARQPDHRVQLLHARPSLDALSKSDPNLIGRHLVLLPGVTQEREYPPRSGSEP